MSEPKWKSEADAGNEALEQKRYPLAEEHFRSALDLLQADLGADDPLLADVIEGLAKVCCARREFTRGRAFYRRLIAIKQRALGDDHPDVMAAKANLAMVRQSSDLRLDPTGPHS